MLIADVSTAARDEAPVTSNPMNDPELAPLFSIAQRIKTIALFPVVTVTLGPAVARSVYVTEVVVSAVPISSTMRRRSTIALGPELTKCDDVIVALAGAVSFRLSRTWVLNWAAVNTVLGMAVIGAVQAMLYSLLVRDPVICVLLSQIVYRLTVGQIESDRYGMILRVPVSVVRDRSET